MFRAFKCCLLWVPALSISVRLDNDYSFLSGNQHLALHGLHRSGYFPDSNIETDTQDWISSSLSSLVPRLSADDKLSCCEWVQAVMLSFKDFQWLLRGKLQTSPSGRGSRYSNSVRGVSMVAASFLQELSHLCCCWRSHYRVYELAWQEGAWQKQHLAYSHLSQEHYGKEFAMCNFLEGRISLVNWSCL